MWDRSWLIDIDRSCIINWCEIEVIWLICDRSCITNWCDIEVVWLICDRSCIIDWCMEGVIQQIDVW